MQKIKNFLKAIRPEEWLAVLVFLVAVYFNVIVYQQQIGLVEALKVMINYFTFDEPFYGWFYLLIYALALFEFYKGLFMIGHDWVVKGIKPTKETGKDLAKKLFGPIRVIIPIALTASPMYQLLSHFSYELRGAGRDVLFAGIDQNLIGGLLFVYLPTWFSSLWFGKLMYYGYLSLSFILSGLLALLYLLKKERLFRTMVAAIIFSFVFSYPLFYNFPCQDPSHAFILNTERASLPEGIQAELADYQVSPFTQNVINKIGAAETNVKRDNAVPISCFPSMHAVWSLIVIFFLARLSRSTILLSIPWLVISLAGGLYFAQHYLVDYVVAIPVAMLSIACGYWLLKLDRETIET